MRASIFNEIFYSSPASLMVCPLAYVDFHRFAACSVSLSAGLFVASSSPWCLLATEMSWDVLLASSCAVSSWCRCSSCASIAFPNRRIAGEGNAV